MRRPLAGIIALLLLGGAAAADATRPARRPSPRTVPALRPGGVWGCPYLFAGGDGDRAWLHLLNAANEPSRIRVTYVRDDAPAVRSNLALGARQATTLTFNKALRKPSAAIVEYAGGDVYVSRTAIVNNAGSKRSGAVGAACSRTETGLVALATGSTLNADTTLAILNPASSDATVDVSIITRDDELRPERLQGLVVPRGTRRTVRLGDYAFDEAAAGALVNIRSGRVVVDGLLATNAGLALVPVQPPSTSLVGLALTERSSARLDVMAPGEDDLVLRSSLITGDARTVFAQLGEQGLESLVPTTLALPARSPGVAVTLETISGGPFVAATRWQAGFSSGRRIDIAAVQGLTAGRRLVAVSGPPASGAQTKIVLANPGDAPAAVTLTLLRGSAPVPLGVRTVQPGRVLVIDAGRFGGVVGIEASADAPVAMMLAGAAPQPKFFAAFAIAASPVLDPPSVAIEVGERAGIPRA